MMAGNKHTLGRLAPMKEPIRVRVGRWLVNVGPRLHSLWRRAVSEDELFQMLTEVQEARTCLEYAEQDGQLVQDWTPEELRRDALQHVLRVEARLRRMSGDY